MSTSSPPPRGTSAFKIALGVAGGIILAGSCAVAGCLFLLAGGVANVAQSEKAVADCRAKAEISGVTLTRRNDFCYVRGTLENACGQTIAYWRISARFLDSKKAVIDTDYTNALEDLRHGEQKKFEIMHRCPPSLDSVTASLEEVRLK